MPWRVLALGAAVVALAINSPAAAKYTDPDVSETEAAVRAALPSAGIRSIEGRVLDIIGAGIRSIEGRVLDIIGAGSDIAGGGSDIAGGGRGIEANVQDLEKAMRDLGAKVTDTEVRIELPADVLFDFDKATIRRDAHDALTKVAAILKGYAKAPVLIEGHTDGKGKEAYNQKLSEQRAESVKTWLVKNAAIETSRLATKGWGMKRPIAPNTKPGGRDDPEGRQKNRRVEITVKKA